MSKALVKTEPFKIQRRELVPDTGHRHKRDQGYRYHDKEEHLSSHEREKQKKNLEEGMYSGRRPEKEPDRKHDHDETKEAAPLPPHKPDKVPEKSREPNKEKDSSEGAGDAEFGLSRSKVVSYGESDLSRMVIDYRMKNGVQGTRNIAVLEYEDNGILKYEIAESNRELGVHSEEILHQRMTKMGIDFSKVKRIYTERQPCNLEPYHHCDNLIYKNYPNAEVTHSFEYGDYDSRKRGNDEMKKAIKALFK